ncbi:MAG: hypothetical protein ACQETB_10685 [Halobacteriota archaeon]
MTLRSTRHSIDGGVSMIDTTAQTTGGSPTLVALVFVALFVATILSLYVATRLYQGYRRGGNRAMLLLGFGLVLLTTVPMVVRLVLTNVPSVDATTRAVVATASQLLGLLVILEVIYDGR